MIMATIRRPDEVIPFSELILSLPSFRCEKPNLIEDFRVETRNIKDIPEVMTIKTETLDVVSIQYLKEFMNQLNRYIGYVDSHLKQRSLTNVLLEAIQTKKGRKLVEDVLNNSKSHPELNICTGEPHWNKYNLKEGVDEYGS